MPSNVESVWTNHIDQSDQVDARMNVTDHAQAEAHPKNRRLFFSRSVRIDAIRRQQSLNKIRGTSHFDSP